MSDYLPVLVSGPSSPLLTMAEVRDHLRLDVDADDPLVSSLLIAATDWFERATDRSLSAKTWRLDLPSFCGSRIELPYPPLVSVTHVKAYDAANVLQTVNASNYEVVTNTVPGAVQLTTTGQWPATYVRNDAVQVTYVAGYATPAAVPQLCKQCVLMLIGAWHENREATTAAELGEVPFGVQAIVQSVRSYRF